MTNQFYNTIVYKIHLKIDFLTSLVTCSPK